MDLTPAFSTAPIKPARQSYADYLQSSWWRKRRDQKLRAVGWRCERCDSKRELQVHHRTYQRLGAELDTDLEAVCRTCHEDHHFDEGVKTHIGLYISLAADVVQSGKRFESDLDLIEDVKIRCARARLDYNTEVLVRAVDIVLGKRPGIQAPQPIQDALERGEAVAPPTHEEAVNLLKQLRIRVAMRSMPNAPRDNPLAADRRKAAQMVARELMDSIARCEALEQAAEHAD